MPADIRAGQAAVVFGASGGIGRALVRAIAGSGRFAAVHGGGRKAPEGLPDAVRPFRFDLTDEASIEAAMGAIEQPIGLAIVATGLLHDPDRGLSPEKSWRVIDGAAMARLFEVNTIGPALVAKHVIPRLPRQGRAVFAALSARVGSIGDNRLGGWHSYRASKAALNMLLANFAIELGRTHPDAIVAGLHPGTVDTGLSEPFQRGVIPEKLFTPEKSAGYLLSVLDGLKPAQSGRIFAWDGQPIPW
ncbi:SDR family NAD(P)-dependent oxidoreductase [Rhizorhabdus sp.]|jgi:NAD(P)-dependent dehydrogenase (short-subunit alcohol dehydrogenase family)|uniref:SDR family NAD(P)-dependent oxidoreductase n=1 Tax=Rhizorhabdus sp. TaxID=1968843 RepID=UPI0035B23D0F